MPVLLIRSHIVVKVLVFLSILMLFSCEKTIELDIVKEKIVLIGYFQPGEPMTVYVSKTFGSLEDTLTFLSDAEVKLYDGDQLVEVFEPSDAPVTEQSQYIAPQFIPEEGKIYTIVVTVPGLGTVTSRAMVPITLKTDPVVRIENLTQSEIGLEQLYQFQVAIEIEDPQDVENFYQLSLAYKQDQYIYNGQTRTYIGYDILPLNYTFDETVDNDPSRLINDFQNGKHVLFTDEMFNGDNKTVLLDVNLNLPKFFAEIDHVEVDLKLLSEEYYRFHSTVFQQDYYKDNPLAEPVIIFNNITNGCGNFSGFQNIPIAPVPFPN